MLIAISQNAISQKIIRQSISCLGLSNVGNGFFLQQTIGQSSNTTTFRNKNNCIRQGFLQPLIADTTNLFTNNSINLTVYPNPFQNYFIILISSDDNTFILNVTDILGKTILNSKITENNEQIINSGEWNKGIYLIHVYYGEKMEAVKKIIKN